MTKDELKKEAEEYGIENYESCMYDDTKGWETDRKAREQAYYDGAESREKRTEELEEKISVLLSCKNCPENKGGFICVKEYENKCLAQKIQYIKELKEENKVLAQNLEDTEILNKTYEKKLNDLKKENAELTKDMASAVPLLEKATVISDLLNKAKEIISEYVRLANLEKEDTVAIWQLYHKAEQFLSEVEK